MAVMDGIWALLSACSLPFGFFQGEDECVYFVEVDTTVMRNPHRIFAGSCHRKARQIRYHVPPSPASSDDLITPPLTCPNAA
jgi:hypothetical protein